MDPTANLSEQIRLAEKLLAGTAGGPSKYRRADAERLAELVEALHGWISAGGFLPAQWQNR